MQICHFVPVSRAYGGGGGGGVNDFSDDVVGECATDLHRSVHGKLNFASAILKQSLEERVYL